MHMTSPFSQIRVFILFYRDYKGTSFKNCTLKRLRFQDPKTHTINSIFS